jgi:hypothetical protein
MAMSPTRFILLAALLFYHGSVACADEPHDLIAHVTATIASRLPILLESTVETQTGDSKGTINLKRYRPAPGGYGSEGAGYGVRGDVPPFLRLMPNELVDPLDPAPETVDVAEPGKVKAGVRALGKEQVDGVNYDVVEITQAPNRALQPPIGGPITFKSVVRKLYIGADGLVYRISGDIAWVESTAVAAGNGAAGAVPVQNTHFVLKVTSYRKPVVFAPRPASQPALQSAWSQVANNQGQYTATVSQDGHLLALGDDSGDIHLIDIRTGKETAVLRGHLERVKALTFSPDAKRLISADSLVIAAWNIETGKLLYTLHDQAEVRTIAVTPDGKSLLTVDDKETGRFRDIVTGRTIHALDKAPMGLYNFSPDGTTLVAMALMQVILWNTKTWQTTPINLQMQLEFFPVAFSPDSARLAFSAYEHTVYVYDTRTGHEIKAVKGAAGGVGSLWFSSDGKALTAMDNDQRGDMADNHIGLTTWDTTSWQAIGSINLSGGNYVQQANLSSTGNTFVLNDQLIQIEAYARTIKVWKFPILPAKP